MQITKQRGDHRQNLSDLVDPTPPKPSAGETPYRSEVYVRARESADGNAYQPGDPIPVAEAHRQRIPDREEVARVRIPRRVPCVRCKDHPGKRAYMKGHRPDCGCIGCQPCHVCGGSERVPADE